MITIIFATKLCKKSCSKFYVIRVVYACKVTYSYSVCYIVVEYVNLVVVYVI